jgi:hypothetical protein
MQANSTGPGVARVTIPGMKAALALVLVALVSMACGRAETGDSEDLRADADRARAEANEALEAVDLMRADLEALEDELADGVARLRRERDRTASKLERVGERLWAALSHIRDSMAGIRQGSAGAASEAASALDEARSAAKAIAILESRFDYHLRRDHGGG